ncbi:MAG: SsrA-binding protein SmpB [Gammaproteobacteria bacterium]|nr:SsrA-binding protein SmpB [Gammaproteobacteria bacterium]
MSDASEIVYNKKVRFDYTIEEELEAGLVLQGWEVKSLRVGKVNISDAYVILRHQEAYLLGARIDPLSTASTHVMADPARTRKLLLKRRELAHLIGCVERSGFTLVPVSLYWKKNCIKMRLAVVKGKKTYDKRETIKDREWQRQQARLFKT